jgi:hypothetical protein
LDWKRGSSWSEEELVLKQESPDSSWEDAVWESVVIIHPDAAKDFVRLFPDEVIEFIPIASSTTPEQEATLSRCSPEHLAVPTR